MENRRRKVKLCVIQEQSLKRKGQKKKASNYSEAVVC